MQCVEACIILLYDVLLLPFEQNICFNVDMLLYCIGVRNYEYTM